MPVSFYPLSASLYPRTLPFKSRPKKKREYIPNASQLSLTGIVFTRFSRRILLWFGFDAPWVTSFSAGG